MSGGFLRTGASEPRCPELEATPPTQGSALGPAGGRWVSPWSSSSLPPGLPQPPAARASPSAGEAGAAARTLFAPRPEHRVVCLGEELPPAPGTVAFSVP